MSTGYLLALGDFDLVRLKFADDLGFQNVGGRYFATQILIL
ncbi:MAG: hypothetical protein DID91_2727704033 [Candidatus Nitrotoga sp. MKT]|nr:MAG: hypothetical protein DID91_2727704033 [Candidatus Nitrotoga sp. MKT]